MVMTPRDRLGPGGDGPGSEHTGRSAPGRAGVRGDGRGATSAGATSAGAGSAGAGSTGAAADGGGATGGCGTVTVHLGGELDLASCSRVEALLQRAESLPVGPGVGVVRLDLSRVEFIDCSGLGVLLRAHQRLGARLLVGALSSPAARLLALTGVEHLFGVEELAAGRSEAVESCAVTGPVGRTVAHRWDRGSQGERAAAGLAQISPLAPLVEVVGRVADLAAGLLPDVEGVCVAVADGPQTSAFIGGLAAFLDERQYDAGFGPCLHTARTGQVHLLDLDLPQEPVGRAVTVGSVGAVGPVGGGEAAAWPEFSVVARRRGVRSVVSLPVVDGRRRPVGAIALYATTGRVSGRARAVAEDLAARTGVVLAAALEHALVAAKVVQLQEALVSRAMIEQAKGVLMAVHGVDADTAFDMLSSTSQATNTKLRVLAADIVERAGR